MTKGIVYWITGLSGAGKTTIAKLLYNHLKQKKNNIVFLDGDILREIFDSDSGHTLEERKKIAMRNSRLCKLLSDQNIDVICATISMFHECHKWNRQFISKYKEIYIKVPIEILIHRNQKQLYSKALNGEIKNVIGIDIKFEEPEQPDIILENNNTLSVDKIFQVLKKKAGI